MAMRRPKDERPDSHRLTLLVVRGVRNVAISCIAHQQMLIEAVLMS